MSSSASAISGSKNSTITSPRGIEALIRRYEMEQGDDVWLCTYKLKEIGCDLEKWEKERGDQ